MDEIANLRDESATSKMSDDEDEQGELYSIIKIEDNDLDPLDETSHTETAASSSVSATENNNRAFYGKESYNEANVSAFSGLGGHDVKLEGQVLRFNNAELFEVWKLMKTKNEKEDAIFNCFEEGIIGTYSQNVWKILLDKSKHFCYRLASNWTGCKRDLKQFKRRHSAWLNSQTIIKLQETGRPTLPSNTAKNRKSVGRPTVPYTSRSSRSQRNAAADLAPSNTVKNEISEERPTLSYKSKSSKSQKSKAADLQASNTAKNATSIGRPTLPYTSKSIRSKRREAAELAASNVGNVNLLIRAASAAARNQGQADLAYVLRSLAKCPEKAKDIRQALSQE